MHKFFEDYLNLLEARHNNILHELDGLPPAALDWNPGIDMNSISVLVVHLTGAERYWIGDVAVQEPSNRDREAEFKFHDVGMVSLKERIDGSLAYARTVLDRMSLADLEQTRVSPSNGETYTVGWALLHALEHVTLHLGHIQLTRQLWESTDNS
jgi:uncharacterized damage-inducible protein DinB